MAEPMFAYWFVFGMLRDSGWPRKAGFLGRDSYVDAVLLDALATQLGHMALGIGGDHPVAAGLFAQAYDWKTGDFDVLESQMDALHLAGWDARFSKVASRIPWTAALDPDTLAWFQAWFIAELLSGLKDPVAASQILEREYSATSPVVAVLGIPDSPHPSATPRSRSEFVRHALGLVESYQREIGALPRDAPLPSWSVPSPRKRCEFRTEVEPRCTARAEFALRITPKSDGSAQYLLCPTHTSSLRASNPAIAPDDWRRLQ